jgi:hypothetical protein
MISSLATLDFGPIMRHNTSMSGKEEVLIVHHFHPICARNVGRCGYEAASTGLRLRGVTRKYFICRQEYDDDRSTPSTHVTRNCETAEQLHRGFDGALSYNEIYIIFPHELAMLLLSSQTSLDAPRATERYMSSARSEQVQFQKTKCTPQIECSPMHNRLN